MKKQVLVVGGAGYIGSHTSLALSRAGYEPVVFDNLSTGHAEFVRFGPGIVADLEDRDAVRQAFRENAFLAVMHFSAFAAVGESVSEPAKYYRNNVANTLNLLEEARNNGVRAFIFSSTCATYGDPEQLPMTEDHPQRPVNPYGRTKLAVEWMLRDFSTAYGLPFAALRYFNASGAAPAAWQAGIGERHHPETHLIPLILKAALDPQKAIRVFGTDYPTPDGTCIRDYIHVCDLADAHLLAMEALLSGAGGGEYNLGIGRGYSVLEVIECARKVTGLPIRVEYADRRQGDPPSLVGEASRARHALGWRPVFTDLEEIVRTAWDWERGCMDGNR